MIRSGLKAAWENVDREQRRFLEAWENNKSDVLRQVKAQQHERKRQVMQELTQNEQPRTCLGCGQCNPQDKENSTLHCGH